MLVVELFLTLCDPLDCSPPGSSVHGILQPIILEWVAILFSRVSSWPRDQTRVSHTAGRSFIPFEPPGSPSARYMSVSVKSLSRVRLFETPWTVGVLPDSCVHGIFQARVLQWVAISFSRVSSWPRDRTQVSHLAGRFFKVWATGKPLWATRVYDRSPEINKTMSREETEPYRDHVEVIQ